MKSFEEMFGVCPEHRLVLVKSRSVGGDIPIERWDHEAYDHRGRLVARYETFIETDPVMGTVRSGWYRYDADGFLADGKRTCLSSRPSSLRPCLCNSVNQSSAPLARAPSAAARPASYIRPRPTPAHPKAMPVILRNEAEFEGWLTAPADVALAVQRPLPERARDRGER
jgi:hypothetical protein